MTGMGSQNRDKVESSAKSRLAIGLIGMALEGLAIWYTKPHSPKPPAPQPGLKPASK